MQYDKIMTHVELLCTQLPEVEQLLKDKKLSLVTIAGVLAETGGFRRFDSPRQAQKPAGLAIKVSGSGKHPTMNLKNSPTGEFFISALILSPFHTHSTLGCYSADAFGRTA